MKYDFLIVGAGFFGATIARILTDAGKTCLVIDKRDCVAGMAFDKKINGTIVGMHGGHIFHTHSEEIWAFINRFCEITPFINRPKILTGNQVYSFPINMMTLHQLWGVITPQEALKKLQEVRIPCNSPRNFEEWILDKVGTEIYDLFIYGYTKKQWMKEPSELPSSIIQRLPIRLTYDENYFTTKYQGIPKDGYTNLVENMLDAIDVKLGIDFFEIPDWKTYANHLIYTGPVDKFFNYEYGPLEYNTLKFEHKSFVGDYQGNAVFNHPNVSVPYIRSIEHKHFLHSYAKHYNSENREEEETLVSFDYPVKFAEHPEPYYPIRDMKNSILYSKYSDLKRQLHNVTFGGRLGEYKYLDIDQSIGSAMAKAKELLK